MISVPIIMLLEMKTKNINDLIDARSIEISRLNDQLDDLDDQNARLDRDKADLANNLRNLKDENIDNARKVSEL